MHLKLDENLPPDAADYLRTIGFGASTVLEQGLGRAADTEIGETCKRDKQVIVTLDLDFSNIRNYPPEAYSGIIVVRLSKQGHDAIMRAFERIAGVLDRYPLDGRLWIVTDRSLRIR